MKLIIQIPCYNEAETLRVALDHLPRHIDNLCQRQCAFMIQVPDVNLLALRAGDINCLLHECSFAFSN